jgi:hypothetical protein
MTVDKRTFGRASTTPANSERTVKIKISILVLLLDSSVQYTRGKNMSIVLKAQMILYDARGLKFGTLGLLT